MGNVYDLMDAEEHEDDILVQRVLEFLHDSRKNMHQTKFICNVIQMSHPEVNFILRELVYDGVLTVTPGHYYSLRGYHGKR